MPIPTVVEVVVEAPVAEFVFQMLLPLMETVGGGPAAKTRTQTDNINSEINFFMQR